MAINAPTGFKAGAAELRAGLRAGWLEDGLHSRLNIPQAIAAKLAGNPGRFVFARGADRTEIDAQALHRRAVGIAGALSAIDVAPGDVVAMQAPLGPDTMALTLGVIYAGAIVLPVVPIYGVRELGFILRQSKAKVLFAPQTNNYGDYRNNVATIEDLPDLKTRVVLGDECLPGDLPWRDFEARGDAAFRLPDTAADAFCLILYTSGTTSDPKGVLHTHQTLQAVMATAGSPSPGERGASVLSNPSAGHIGQLLQLLGVMLHGETIVTMDRWSPDVAARLVERYRCARMSGAPVFLYTTLDAARTLGADVSSISEVMLGSTAIMPSDIVAWEKLGICGYRAYGSTEHGFATGRLPHPSERVRAYTDGLPSAGTRIRILDDGGEAVGQGEAGEIALIGPQQFIGYLNPQANAEAFTADGWFLTGDIGRLDADGALTITDRKKDIIIRGGENISAKEVEDALASLSWVVECAAVSMPDERLGEKVCAFVIARDPPTDAFAAVREHFAALGLAKQKTPERLEIVPDMPRTPTGKIKKFELRDRLRNA